MKKITILFIATMTAFYGYSQTYLPLTGGNLTGNLYIEGGGAGRINLLSSYSGSPAHPGFEIRNYAGDLTFQHNSNGAATYLSGHLTGASATFNGNINLSGNFQISDASKYYGAYFQTNDYSTMTFLSRAWATVQGANGKAFSFQTHDNAGGGGFEMMAIYYGEDGKITMAPHGGNVGIGTSTPNEKLSVNGKIRAKEVKVEAVNWPDYVFAPSYNLPDLKAIDQFIKANGHLPEIPSAAEVDKDGISLGELNAKLLKKIEELTLYLIDQNKIQRTLLNKVNELDASNEQLKFQIEQLNR